jgi:hypothetical protein
MNSERCEKPNNLLFIVMYDSVPIADSHSRNTFSKLTFWRPMMTLPNLSVSDELEHEHTLLSGYSESVPVQASAVSWGAILAGAAAAAALSLILLMLGTGLGLSSVSPWAYNGVSATTFGVSAILWLTLTQIIASGMGGYLAGRLRIKWLAVQTDEVYFRDTAHGFLAWAVASLATAALLSSVIGSIVNGGVQAGATVAGGVAAGSEMLKHQRDGEPMGYFVDLLFRKDNNIPIAKVSAMPIAVSEGRTVGFSPEVTRIFMNTAHTAPLSAEDVQYVGYLVAQRTGLTQQNAEKRVISTYARLQTKLHDAETAAREAANKARKASAYAALWLFISLLIGAFVASGAATFGGRQRDL